MADKITVDELNVVITANKEEMSKAIGDLSKELNSLKGVANQSTKGITAAFSKLKAGIAALGIGRLIQQSLSVGMEAIETASLFTTTLGSEMAEEVNEWSMSVSKALGLSNTAMQKNIGTIYNIASSMGVGSTNAIKMSEGVALLAQDMASFYNISAEEAFNKIRSGLVGVSKPLQELGIVIDADTVKQTAYKEGIAEVGKELTQEQEVLARYVAILQRTSTAQGDLSRTITSPANQTRIFKNNIQELLLAISRFTNFAYSYVIPVVNQIVAGITGAVNALANLLGIASVNNLQKGLASGAVALGAGLEEANNQAKELKGNLAGFDEMNVLNENNSGSSSAGGATGVTAYDLAAYDAGLEKLGSTASVITETIQNTLGKVFEAVSTVVTFVKDNWPTISAILAGVATALLAWNGYFAILNLIPRIMNLKNTIGTMASNAMQNFQKLWALIAANPIVALIAVVAGLVAAFVTAYKTNDQFREKVDTAWAGIKERIGNTIEAAKVYFENFKAKASEVFENVKAAISNTIEKIKSKFEEIKTKIVNVGTAIKNAFTNGGELFKGFKDGLENVFKTLVNSVLKGMNTIISWPLQKLNGMLNTIREVSFLGISPFKNLWGYSPIAIPQIPLLAKGGVVSGATLAMIGEAGQEAVMPLENNTEWIDKLADKLNSNGKPTQIIVKVGDTTLVDKVIQGINEKEYRTGKAVLNV